MLQEKRTASLDYLHMSRTAQTALQAHVRQTPLQPSRILSELCSGNVYLKLENLQLTGSFKFRGAYTKIASLTPAQKNRGVITVSAGNHAQGVALTARLLGLDSTVVMPTTAPKSKQQATRGYGAKVLLHGETFDQARTYMEAIAAENQLTIIDPYNDPLVIAGQGTIGLELLEQLQPIDTLLVPVGGGGLLCGLAAVFKAASPRTQIFGVQSQNVHGMTASLAQGRQTHHRKAATLADGTAVAYPGSITFALAQKWQLNMILVSESAIQAAMQTLLTRGKVLAEGAGALTAAALLSGAIPPAATQGKNVVALVSGGNVDVPPLWP